MAYRCLVNIYGMNRFIRFVYLVCLKCTEKAYYKPTRDRYPRFVHLQWGGRDGGRGAGSSAGSPASG